MSSRIIDTGSRGNGAAPARAIPVWDPLVRIIHWSVAGAVVLNGFVLSGESHNHERIGYAILGLVGLRAVWGLVGTRHARFSAFPPNPLAALRHLGDLKKGRSSIHLSHNPAGALMVYNLWATLIGLGVTGIMMGTIRFFGLGWVEQLHRYLFDWLLLSVVLHLAGVLIDTVLTKVPLVPAMVHGRKRLPVATEAESN